MYKLTRYAFFYTIMTDNAFICNGGRIYERYKDFFSIIYCGF